MFNNFNLQHDIPVYIISHLNLWFYSTFDCFTSKISRGFTKPLIHFLNQMQLSDNVPGIVNKLWF